jgi:hypothetical protein
MRARDFLPEDRYEDAYRQQWQQFQPDGEEQQAGMVLRWQQVRPNRILVQARSGDGSRELGSVQFHRYDPASPKWTGEALHVDERYRRQGVATAMYDWFKKKFGPIRPSDAQTRDGESFWQRKKVWEQGVAEGRVINTHLWHGSRNKHPVLEPRQAVDTGGAAGSNQNAIYATNDPKIAIAMGLTTAGSDTAMFPNDPQMVLFSGKIRKGENVYLHRLPMNGPDGKPQFVQGGNSREFHSVPGVKGIEPTEIKAVPVNKYLNLIRKATREDWALRKKFMKKQDVLEGQFDSLIKSDQAERNAYKKFVADRAGGDWKKGARLYAKLKNRPADDIFGDDARLQQFMRIKFDFANFTKQDWRDFWLLSQHADAYPGFQQQALDAIQKHLGQDNDYYRYLADRISCARTGQQKYGTQDICDQQGVQEGTVDFSRNLAAFRVYQHLDPMEFYNFANTPQGLKTLAQKAGTTPESVKDSLERLDWGQFPDDFYQDSEDDEQGVAEGENHDIAISLSRLGKFHHGEDPLAEFVPERATAQYALHPDKWQSTFHSLTNKDSDKLKYYGPKKIPIPPGTLVGDMAIANKFYRAKTSQEKQHYADAYRESLQPYPVDVSLYRMPELLMPKPGVAEGKVKLYTDPDYFGAEVDDSGFDSLPVVNIPANQLIGFEPDDKMNQPKSQANVEKIVAGLKKGDKLPPILVRKYKNGYQVLDGHHRFRAYKSLKIKSIPARIVPAKDIEEMPREAPRGAASKQGVAESLDQPYRIKWGRSMHGDYDALATLDDGTYLSIMFNKESKNNWMVEFYRNNSQQVTGEGEAQRVFATVLTAIAQFIKKKKPVSLFFSAVKEDDPKGSREKLYDRLVQRYAGSLGYAIHQGRTPMGSMTYKFTRKEQGVAEGWRENLAAAGIAGALATGTPAPAQAQATAATDPIVATLQIDGETRRLDLSSKGFQDVREAERWLADFMRARGIVGWQGKIERGTPGTGRYQRVTIQGAGGLDERRISKITGGRR